jgi:CheY-like chemotaxis protein
VISMGRSLKLRVIAEGVETQEELAFLQAHQCVTRRKGTISEDNLLLIEDNPADAKLVREALTDTRFGPFQIEWVKNLSDGLQRLSKGGIQAVLADLLLPDSQGIETLDRLLLAAPRVPILVLSGLDDQDIASQTYSTAPKIISQRVTSTATRCRELCGT